MSRFQGWLAAYVAWKGTDKALTKAEAAKRAGVRAATFTEALKDRALIAADAKAAGFDPREELLNVWMLDAQDAPDPRALSTTTNAQEAGHTGSVVRLPTSDRYTGGTTAMGTIVPSGTRYYTGPHPEPDGAWHRGLERALPVPRYYYQWRNRCAYLDTYREAS